MCTRTAIKLQDCFDEYKETGDTNAMTNSMMKTATGLIDHHFRLLSEASKWTDIEEIGFDAAKASAERVVDQDYE